MGRLGWAYERRWARNAVQARRNDRRSVSFRAVRRLKPADYSGKHPGNFGEFRRNLRPRQLANAQNTIPAHSSSCSAQRK